MNCESVLNYRSISQFLNLPVPEMFTKSHITFALNFGQSNVSHCNGDEMWKVCTLGKKNRLLPCSSCLHGNLRKVVWAKSERKRERGLLSPCGWFTTKVCYTMICSPLFSRKESWKNKHLVLGMSERIKTIWNPISSFEQNTYSFPVLVLKSNSSHSRFLQSWKLLE